MLKLGGCNFPNETPAGTWKGYFSSMDCLPMKKSGVQGVKAGPVCRAAIPYIVLKVFHGCLAFHVAPKQLYRCMLSKHSFVFVFHPPACLPPPSTDSSWMPSKAAAAAVRAASSTHRSRVSRVRQCVCNSRRQGRNCNCSSSCDDL